MKNMTAVLYVYDDGTTAHTSSPTLQDAAKVIFEHCSTRNVISALGITFIDNKSTLVEFNSKCAFTEKELLDRLVDYTKPLYS
jgi:hypothetical protein